MKDNNGDDTMTKKEQIILATLELASQNGLGAVSMGQIADRLFGRYLYKNSH